MRLFAIALLAGLLAGCSPAEQPLRVGLLEWPPYEILRLADDLDYLAGQEFEIVEFDSPAEAERAYAVGGIDIVALTLDYLVELAGNDPDHRAFLIIDESAGGDALISRAPIAELSELAGKRVAVEFSELGAYFLSRMLDRAGLSLSDIETVYVDIPDQVRAWQQGKVDAIVTYEPMRSRLLALGGHEVFSSRDLPGEIIDVFIARQSLLDSRGSDMRRFTRAWFRALRRWNEDRDTFAAQLARNLDMHPDDFLRAMDGARLISLADNRHLLGDGKQVFLNNIQRFIDAQAVNGRTLPDELLPRLFTPAVLPQATGMQ